jgi:OFA family oxalate/formate antiporter-like MFS transporter
MSQLISRRPIYFGYWLIGAAFVAQFAAAGMQNYVIGPFLTPMTLELEWTRAEYTISRTIGQFVAAGAGFLIGAKVDRYGPRRFMLTGAVLLAIALFLSGYVTSLWHWIVLNGLAVSIGASLVGNFVVNVTLSRWFVNFRGRAIAFAAMGVSAAGIVLTPLVTFSIDAVGWRDTWHLLGLGTLLVITPICLVMRRSPEDYGLEPDGGTAVASAAQRVKDDFANSLTRREALRTVTFYWLVIVFGLFTINIPVMLLQTLPFMTDAGFSRSTGAFMIVLISIPAFASKPVWGWLIDGVRGAPLAAISSALSAVSLVMIVFGVSTGPIWVTYAGFVLLGFGWGGMIPLQEVIWASYFGRRHLGAVRSAALPFALVFGAGAPLATSYSFDVIGNYNAAFLTLAALSLLAAVLLLVVPKPR